MSDELCPSCQSTLVIDGAWIDRKPVARICISCGYRWPIRGAQERPPRAPAPEKAELEKPPPLVTGTEYGA